MNLGIATEYVHVPIGTKFVFHRNDAFQNETGRNLADKWPTNDGPALSDNEKKVLSALGERGNSTTSAIAKATGIAERSARRALSKLVKYGLVVSEGANKKRTYRISKQDD